MELGALKFATEAHPFVYASGLKGPLYCDNRLIMSDLMARSLVTKGFFELIKKQELAPDLLVAMATAGIAPTAFLAHKMQLPMLYVRSKAKAHGTSQLIEGRYQKGQKVILIDDLVNQASSISKGAQVLRDAGLELMMCLSIVDYQMPQARKNLAQFGEVSLCSLVGFTDIVDYLKEQNFDSEQIDALKKWHLDPSSWS